MFSKSEKITGRGCGGVLVWEDRCWTGVRAFVDHSDYKSICGPLRLLPDVTHHSLGACLIFRVLRVCVRPLEKGVYKPLRYKQVRVRMWSGGVHKERSHGCILQRSRLSEQGALSRCVERVNLKYGRTSCAALSEHCEKYEVEQGRVISFLFLFFLLFLF